MKHRIKHGIVKPTKSNRVLKEERTNGKFTRMYTIDSEIENRNSLILNTDAAKKLIRNALKLNSSLALLDQVVTDVKIPFLNRLKNALNPFYNFDKYSTKENYLQYLKNVYGFLISPLEEQPNVVLNTFYKNRARSWEPAPKEAVKLLEQFYLETQLIRDMPTSTWSKVRRSSDPESALFRELYGIRFSNEFEKFLSAIPWRFSNDVYGAPALDLVAWRAPGLELVKRPMAAELDFLERLVQSNKDREVFREIYLEEWGGNRELLNTHQIERAIKNNGKAIIDSYVGISKRETDFVLHQRIIIWSNPGFNVYHKSPWKKRVKMVKPPEYLASINERMVPLEIPFLSAMEFQN